MSEQFLESERGIGLLQFMSLPSEKRKSTAGELALPFAYAVHRSVVVDCDSRRLRGHDVSGLTNSAVAVHNYLIARSSSSPVP
jgi:hypothetical protein